MESVNSTKYLVIGKFGARWVVAVINPTLRFIGLGNHVRRRTWKDLELWAVKP